MSSNLLSLTANIVAAYAEHNEVTEGELSGLIRAVGRALADTANPPKPASGPRQKPAVPIRQSVFPDYIVSLEDGRKLKSMKRYLATLDMTPEEYRAKWGLPPDYPMVAPGYSKQRSKLAKASGLGKGEARQKQEK